jgi:hypothetical protein
VLVALILFNWSSVLCNEQVFRKPLAHSCSIINDEKLKEMSNARDDDDDVPQ